MGLSGLFLGPFCRFGAVMGLFGALLGLYCSHFGHFGAVLGNPRAILGQSWGHLGAVLNCFLDCFWGRLGPFSRFGAVLGLFGALCSLLGLHCRHFGHVSHFGQFWGCIRPSLGHPSAILGPSWGCSKLFWSILGLFWTVLGAVGATLDCFGGFFFDHFERF